MLQIEEVEPGRFQIAFTDRALAVLTECGRVELSAEEAAEYGDMAMPPAEVLREAIRKGLGLSAEDAADLSQSDLDDGLPF